MSGLLSFSSTRCAKLAGKKDRNNAERYWIRNNIVLIPGIPAQRPEDTTMCRSYGNVPCQRRMKVPEAGSEGEKRKVKVQLSVVGPARPKHENSGTWDDGQTVLETAWRANHLATTAICMGNEPA